MRIAAQYRAFFVKIKLGLFYTIVRSYASRTQTRTPRPSETLPAVRQVFIVSIEKDIYADCLNLPDAGVCRIGRIFLVAT